MCLIESILQDKLTDFIGRFNVVMKLKGDWYQIPFNLINNDEMLIGKYNLKEFRDNIEMYAIIDSLHTRMMDSWGYFAFVLKQYKIENSKLKNNI
jgi:hypothetical protein